MSRQPVALVAIHARSPQKSIGGRGSRGALEFLTGWIRGSPNSIFIACFISLPHVDWHVKLDNSRDCADYSEAYDTWRTRHCFVSGTDRQEDSEGSRAKNCQTQLFGQTKITIAIVSKVSIPCPSQNSLLHLPDRATTKPNPFRQ